MVDFAGVEAKIKRTDAHLQFLRSEVESFIALNPPHIAFEDDPETGKSLMRVIDVPVTPIEWGVILGDVIHCLRSSLDHLIWQLTPRSARGNRTQFPIFHSETDFLRYVEDPWRTNKPSPLRGMDERTFAVIKRVQPFAVGDGRYRAHGLWILNELSNVDKHKVVHSSLVALTDQPPRIKADAWLDAVEIELSPGPLVKDAVVGYVLTYGERPEPGMEMQTNFTLDVRIGDIQLPLAKMPVLRNVVVLALNEVSQFHGPSTTVG